MNRTARVCLCVLMFAIFVFSPALSHAQELAGLVGTVTDESGGAIGKATVTLVNTRTGTSLQSQTGDTGLYRFVQLAPGPGYELRFSKDGFKSVTISNLYLAVATTRTQDIQLAVGTVTQTVEVKSEGSVSLDTTDSTIGNNFDLRAVSSLPNEFRGNAANLLRLQPAVVSADTSSNPFDDNGASRNGAVAGARADQDNITVDGIDASDFGIGQAFTQVAPTPVDAIQEFRTEVANPLAQEGRGSGAQTIITTKSGTNEWHGNAREYHRNTVTEANDFFNNKNGVKRPALIRNQFGGSVGGPIKRDRLFFFFDYDARRDASQIPVTRIVPLDNVRQGKVAYINNGTNPATGKPCDATSTQTSTPACISFADATALTQLDPCSNPATAQGPCTVTGNAGDAGVAPGFNPGLLALFNSRYPHANELGAGDGINTGGFIFNAPNPDTVNSYTTRVDFNINSKQKLYTRFTFYNVHAIVPGLQSIQYPGDPITNPAINQDRSWVIGHNWVISPTLVNTFVYGESRAEFDGQAVLTGAAAPGPDLGVYAGLNWLFPTGISAPYARPGGNSSLNPVPTFRDDISWQKGKHSFQFGGVFRPIRTRSLLVNNIIFTNQGLVTNLGALDANLRPGNILSDPAVDPNGIAASNWDAVFASFAGLDGLQFSVFNYAKNGNVIPPVAGARRDYRYYETETYAQDTWKVRRDLTVTLGLRYGYDSVPYESNGYESTTNVQLSNLLATRSLNGSNGTAAFDSTPILTYVLAGKANSGGRSLYQSNPLNFSPRLGLAWNPGFKEGPLGSIFGEHKTVVRASAALIYDHAALSAINFIQDQSSYIFSGNNSFSANASTPEQLFAISPRFVTADTAAVNIPIPPFQSTVTPFTGNQCPPGFPVCGTLFNQFGNYVIAPNYKTPYSLAYSLGMQQRELPAGFQLEADYVLRLGRRLGTLADGGQIFNFVDPASKQGLVSAVTALELDARNNVPVSQVQPQPFFENQMAAAGANCSPFTNCTQFVYGGSGNFTLLQQGNLNGLIRGLTQSANLPPNVGFSSQFVSNYYLSNKSYSDYNGLILILRKRLSQGVQMDFNYTYSHSIDNFSGVANNNGNPFNNAQSVLCDAVNLGTCKGNSEFDVTHQISGDAIYDLPFGRGKTFGRNSSRWLDEIIGGWQASGIYTWRTGFAFPVLSSVSTTTFGNTAYPIFNGNSSALAVNPHTDPNLSNNGIQLFQNPAAALAAFSAPTGLQTGSRDELRGPHFSNVDVAVVKSFPLFREKYKLQFRAEAYNAFNHPNFALPANTNFQQTNFGQITHTSSTSGDQQARVLQFALRLDF
jgi:Carboxypeptidase regulatory-like domain